MRESTAKSAREIIGTIALRSAIRGRAHVADLWQSCPPRDRGGIVNRVTSISRFARLSLILTLGVGAPRAALAQTPVRLELSAGFQGGLSGDIEVGASATSPAATYSGLYESGFNVDGSMRLTGNWSVVAELGWMRNFLGDDPLLGSARPANASHANFNALNYGGGLRWQQPGRATRFFAQVLVGGQRDNFDVGSGPALGLFVGQAYAHTSFHLQPGAGIVIRVTDLFGVVGQADFRQVFSDPSASFVRYVVGIRYAPQ